MNISSAPQPPADKAGHAHRARLLVGRAICWFTDPVHAARREACAQHAASSAPSSIHSSEADLTHLPVFKSGRRPPFFYDAPVRDLLIGCLHRMTIDQARELCISEFGVERTPSRTAIHKFWQRLDADSRSNPSVKGYLEAAYRKVGLILAAVEAQESMAEIQLVRVSNPRPADFSPWWAERNIMSGWHPRPSLWKRFLSRLSRLVRSKPIPSRTSTHSEKASSRLWGRR